MQDYYTSFPCFFAVAVFYIDFYLCETFFKAGIAIKEQLLTALMH